MLEYLTLAGSAAAVISIWRLYQDAPQWFLLARGPRYRDLALNYFAIALVVALAPQMLGPFFAPGGLKLGYICMFPVVLPFILLFLFKMWESIRNSVPVTGKHKEFYSSVLAALTLLYPMLSLWGVLSSGGWDAMGALAGVTVLSVFLFFFLPSLLTPVVAFLASAKRLEHMAYARERYKHDLPGYEPAYMMSAFLALPVSQALAFVPLGWVGGHPDYTTNAQAMVGLLLVCVAATWVLSARCRGPKRPYNLVCSGIGSVGFVDLAWFDERDKTFLFEVELKRQLDYAFLEHKIKVKSGKDVTPGRREATDEGGRTYAAIQQPEGNWFVYKLNRCKDEKRASGGLKKKTGPEK